MSGAGLRYGTDHRRLRRKLAAGVAMGLFDCPTCGEQIQPGEEWDLGHTEDRTAAVPEHRHCNRAVWTKLVKHSRDW